ncbi:hypothetical protein ABPG75_000468 [Micractinium tetrahymenae]
MSSRAIAQEWAKGWPKLAQIQKAVQTNPALVHHKFGASDKLTSTYIPVGLSVVSTILLVPGLFKMYLGFGQIEP